MTDDVVAELDRWLASPASLHEATVSHAFLQAARDEIMALRQEMTHDSAAIATLCNHAHDEALEEAARVCDAYADQPTVDTVSLPDTIEKTAHAVVQQSIAAVTCAAVIRARVRVRIRNK